MTPDEKVAAARGDWQEAKTRYEVAEGQFIAALLSATKFKVGDIVEARRHYREGLWREAIVRRVRVWSYGGPLAQTDYVVSYRKKDGEFSKAEAPYVDVRQVGSDVERSTFTGKITKDML